MIGTQTENAIMMKFHSKEGKKISVRDCLSLCFMFLYFPACHIRNCTLIIAGSLCLCVRKNTSRLCCPALLLFGLSSSILQFSKSPVIVISSVLSSRKDQRSVSILFIVSMPPHLPGSSHVDDF